MKPQKRQRAALNVLFFLSGLCFSSWASRIPDIKASFELSDSALGALLLIRPAGALVGLPVAGLIVDKYGSKHASAFGVLIFSFSLLGLGFAPSIPFFASSLLIFGLAANLINISNNAQALLVQKNYGKIIMASFHGLWSLAGFFGAAIGALALFLDLDVPVHFLIIAVLVVIMLLVVYPHLSTEKESRSKFQIKKPDRHLVKLGFIAFCGLLCEGCMFDWSGVYFKQVVNAEEGLIAAGYMAFMGMMALGRLVSDSFTNKFGSKRVVQISGGLIFTGLIVAVLFPNLYMAILGFLLVGAGTSSVIPLTYHETGKSKLFPSGIALAIVSTIGYFGFMLGPPLIGFLADLINLRASFTLVAFVGITISILVSTKD